MLSAKLLKPLKGLQKQIYHQRLFQLQLTRW